MDKLLSILQELMKRIEVLQKQTNEFQAALKQTEDPKKLRSLAEAYAAEVIAAGKAEMADLKTAEGIVRDTRPPATKPVKADTFVRHFRSVIEGIQKEAQDQPEGQLGVTLKSFDVEMKGLIVVEGDSAAIITPTPDQAVDPGQLSTVRMSYGAVPVLRAAATTPPEGTKGR